MSKHLNKNASIKQIFENMDYDNNSKENISLVSAWCKKYGNNFKTSSTKPEKVELSNKYIIEVNKINPENVCDFLKECTLSEKISDSNLAHIFNKISTEVEKNSTLICQLETIFSDIFVKDAKKYTVPVLKNYFQYYSGWGAIKVKNFPNLTPYGLCVVNLDKKVSLSILGMILPASLAAGNTVILNVDANLVPICFLIREIAILSGLPKNAIQIVNGDLQVLLKHESIKKLVYIGDLFSELYTSLQVNPNVDLCTLHVGKSNMLVFDSADLDSVTDAILESTFSYKGYFPWSVDQVFVQETIYENLKSKLHKKFERLKIVENATMKIGDITKNSMIQLKFGHREAGNNILCSNDAQFLHILPFRTATEGVALANNSRCGLATSVWCENISLANEINPKLKTTFIWYNNWGQIDPNITFTPYKKSGKGYFSGKEGFLEFLKYENKTDFVSKHIMEVDKISCELPGAPKPNIFMYFGGFKKGESGLDIPNKKDIQKFVEIALKAQESWKKLSASARGQHLRKFADNSQIIEKEIPSWSDMLYQLSMRQISHITDAQGVVVIDMYTNSVPKIFNIIFGAIYLGNSVIIVNKSDKYQLLNEICIKCNLPPGIFNVINYHNDEINNTLKNHQEISTYFSVNNLQSFVKINEINKFTDLKKIDFDSFDDFSRSFTKNKNVFFSSGDSFM